MLKHIIFSCIALLALPACEHVEAPKPSAVGSPGEIIVVTDTATWSGPVGDAIRAALGSSVAPPLGGLADFRLVRRDLNNEHFNLLRSTRHLIFAAALDDTTAVPRFLEARLDAAGIEMIKSGEGTLVLQRPGLWATNQLVVMATAGTDELLAEAIRNDADSLQVAFTNLSLAATEEDMFDRARQQNLENELMTRHQFAVKVQHDYFLSQDTTLAVDGSEGHFVRLRRVLSDTWRDYFVYYEDLDAFGVIDSTHVEQVTDVALETFVRGQYESSYVQVDRARPISKSEVVINDNAATLHRGLWRMTDEFMGGPFVRYTFVDEEQERLYIFFGMIFAPQHRFRGQKREFLRQIEVTAQTFRTSDEAQ